jgi:hypothetical protein
MARATGHPFSRQLFGSQPEAQIALLRALWPQLVGSGLAQRTEVLALEGVTLRIRVADERWKQVLHNMRRTILDRMAERAGPLAPRALAFTLGLTVQVSEASEAAPADPLPPPKPPASVVASAEAIAEPALRKAFLETAARYLDRFGAKGETTSEQVHSCAKQ